MFDSGETESIIREKLLPVLEELARAEFGIFSMYGAMDEREEKWMEASEKKMEELVCNYLRGLLSLHLQYGKKCTELERKED